MEDARGNRLLARNARAAPGGLLFLFLPLSAKRSAAAPEAGRPEVRRRLAGARPAAPRSTGGNRPRGRRRREARRSGSARMGRREGRGDAHKERVNRGAVIFTWVGAGG